MGSGLASIPSPVAAFGLNCPETLYRGERGSPNVRQAAIWISLFRLLLTGVGAFIAARAVITSERQATALASAKWDINVGLRNSLLDQSKTARNGLALVVVGTVFQVIGTALPLWS
jgi:hypothetical protein